jgi:hypothetical protein
MPGRTADNRDGRNSPYTTAFLKNIETKEEIGTIFRRIGADVYQTTHQAQLPELSLSLIGEFYLNGKLQITATRLRRRPLRSCKRPLEECRNYQYKSSIWVLSFFLAAGIFSCKPGKMNLLAVG